MDVATNLLDGIGRVSGLRTEEIHLSLDALSAGPKLSSAPLKKAAVARQRLECCRRRLIAPYEQRWEINRGQASQLKATKAAASNQQFNPQ